MNQTPEQLALQHSLALCQGHADALQDALHDIKVRGMGVDDYAIWAKKTAAYLTNLPTVTPGCKTTWAPSSYPPCLRH